MGKIVSALKTTGNLIVSNHLRQKIFLICLLALFAFVYVMIFAPSKTQTVQVYDASSPRAEQKISTASPLSLPLKMSGGNPSALTFYFARPDKDTPDQYTLQILDAAGKPVFFTAFSTAGLAEGKYKLSFSLTGIPKGGGDYTLQITAKSIADENAVSIYTRTSAGTVVPEADVTYALGISPWVFKLSFITVLAGCILILFYSKKLHVNILATLLVFGVLFALLTPIMDVPDEATHVGKVFMVAGGTLFNPPGGGMVSRAVIQITQETGVATHSQTIVDNVLLGKAAYQGMVGSTFGASQSLFLGYLPAALIINLCLTLQTNVLTILYAGRIIDLVVYAVCVFFALKLAPRYKLFFGVIAVAPMALYIAASYNGDYLTYGMALLLAAMYTRFYFKKDFIIDYKQIVWFSVVCAVICMIKYYFLPLCLLLLFIPSGRFASKKTKWLGVLLCIAITGFAAIGLYEFQQYQIVQSGATSAVGSTDLNIMGANVGQQLHFIMGNLTSAGAILIRAFVVNASDYLQKLFAFGWLKSDTPTIFVYLYAAFIALTAFVYSKYERAEDSFAETRHSPVSKFGILIILLLGYAAINTLFYLIWSPVGANYIQGVQGRYFIPLLLFLPFLSGNTGPRMDEAAYTKKQNYILFTAQAFIILSIIQILFTYY